MPAGPLQASIVLAIQSAAVERPALAVEGLRVSYHSVLALDDVSLELPRGSLTALIGPNGAGKSTLFQALLGLVPPARGAIRLDGRSAHESRFAFGYLPQAAQLDLDFTRYGPTRGGDGSLCAAGSRSSSWPVGLGGGGPQAGPSPDRLTLPLQP